MSRYLLAAYTPSERGQARPCVLIWEQARQLGFTANAYLPEMREIDPVAFLRAFPRQDEELWTYAEWVKGLHDAALSASLPEIQEWVAHSSAGAFHIVETGEVPERQQPESLLSPFPASERVLVADAVVPVVEYLVREAVFHLGQQGVRLDLSAEQSYTGAYVVHGKRRVGIFALPLSRPVVSPRGVKRVRADLAALRSKAEHWLLLTNRGDAARLVFGEACQVLELGAPTYVEQVYAWLRQLGKS